MSSDQAAELKEAVKEALFTYDSEVIIKMLIEQGYDPFYAKSLVEEAEEDSQVIPSMKKDTAEGDNEQEVMMQAQQQEESTAEKTRQELMAYQQQAADDDAEDDEYQDIAEKEYFNFARNGGMIKANYGMEMNSMPNAQYSQGLEQPYTTWSTMEGDLMRDGGMSNKKSFLKKMTNHLMKANMGMEQNSQMPSPYGDVSNPTGLDISGKQNYISALNKQTQMFQAKQQAEQMYNNMYDQKEDGRNIMQFGSPADQHDMLEHLNLYVQSFSNQLQEPTSMETADYAKFGGAKNRRIKRANRALFGTPFMPPGAKVDYEFGPLGGLRNASAETDITQFAELFKMLPGSPNANPFVTLPSVINEIGYKLKVNQGRLVDKVITNINNQSIKEVAAATGNGAAQQKSKETPTISTSGVIPAAISTKSTVIKTAAKPASSTKTSNKAKVQTKTTKTTNTNGLPNIGKEVKELSLVKKYANEANIKSNNAYMYSIMPSPYGMEDGGFVDAENPDLYEFIYGGYDDSIPYINDTDMYRQGGSYLPKAAPGMQSFDQFRLQKMNPDGTMKNKPTLPGGEELMGNPYTQPQQPLVQPSVAPNPTQAPIQNPAQGQYSPQQMQQMQQYMQMMQQMGKQNPYAFGAPRGLGLGRAALQGLTGISRDFNYMSGDNPANWNIPEGYTKLRKEVSKDRGQKFNPFDTKRITNYEFTKPGEQSSGPMASKVENAPGYNPNAAGPGYSGYNADANGDGMPDYLEFGNNKSTVSKQNQSVLGPNGPTALPSPIGPMNNPMLNSTTTNNSPYRSNVKGLDDESRVSIRAGERAGRINERRAMRQQDKSGMAYGGEMYEDGGYVPDYYTFDGYLPMALNGIVSDTPDFLGSQDPNAINFTTEEESAFSFDPRQLGNNMSLLKNTISNQADNIQSANNQRFGSNKNNYSTDIDRELAYRGITDQEGIDKKAGYETGRTYTGKYGGSKYKAGGQYKNGGTYSLTREQIDQIRKMGGDVEFI